MSSANRRLRSRFYDSINPVAGNGDIQELCAPQDRARNKICDRPSPAELRSKIAVLPIIVLCSGIIVEVFRSGGDPTGGHPLSPKYAEYDYIEYFDMACMSLAIIWAVRLTVEVSRAPRDYHTSFFPIALLWFRFVRGAAALFFQAWSFFAYPCSTVVSKAYPVIKAAFIFAQVILFTCYKRRRAIINHTVVNGSLLYLTVVCNVILYIRTFVESKDDFRPSKETTISEPPMLAETVPFSNVTPAINCSSRHDTIISLYNKLDRFLYPFFLEFAVTASATLAEIWLRGDYDYAERVHHPSQTVRRLAAPFLLVFVLNVVMSLVTSYMGLDASPTSDPYTMGPALKINCSADGGISAEVYDTASAYTSPFLLEFTLTASSMLSELWIETEKNDNTSTDPTNSTMQDVKLSLWSIVPAIAAAMAELSIVVVLRLQKDTGHLERVLYGYRMGMALIMTLVCFAGFRSCAKNDSRESHSSLDEVLLMIAVIGVFAFAAVEFVASLACFTSSNPDNKTNVLVIDAIFASVENFLWIIQASVQVAFVVRALHRQPLKQHTANLGLFMALFNAVMWFVDTIHVEGQAKSLYGDATLRRMNELEVRFLGDAWDYVILTAYPLRIFFRIHSAAMFCRVRNLHKKIPTNQDSAKIN